MARTKSSPINTRSVPAITLQQPETAVEAKEENNTKVCPHCSKILNELYDAGYDEHIGQCSSSSHVASQIQPAASGASSPLSTFSRSPSPVSEIPVVQAAHDEADDDEDGLISRTEGGALDELVKSKHHENQKAFPPSQSLNDGSVAASPFSPNQLSPRASFPRINTYVTREVLETVRGKKRKRVEYVMEDYTEDDDLVTLAAETENENEAIDGTSTPIPKASQYISSPMANGELPYDSEVDSDLPAITNHASQLKQALESSITGTIAPTSKPTAAKRTKFRKLVPAETVIQYISNMKTLSEEETHFRTSQTANVLKDIQDEWEVMDLKVREGDAYIKAQVKEAKEAERIIDEQKILEDEPELMKVLEEFEEVLRQREKGWKISLDQILKTGLKESDPEKFARLLRLKAEPKLLKDIAEKLAKAQQPENNRRYVSMRNPRQAIEPHKSDRLTKRSRLEPMTRWDDRKMMDAYGLPYSSAEGRIGDQFLPDQTKVDENGELVYENGRPKRSRAKRQVYDTEPSGAPSPEKGEEILPAKRRRYQRKNEDLENAINDDSSRPQTPLPKKYGSLAKTLAAKQVPGAKVTKGAAAKTLKAKKLLMKASGNRLLAAAGSDGENAGTPIPDEDNLEHRELASEELDPEDAEAEVLKVNEVGGDEGNAAARVSTRGGKKRIGRPPKNKPRKIARRVAKLEDDDNVGSAVEAEEEGINEGFGSEEEGEPSRLTHAQGQELEESVRSMMEQTHNVMPSQPLPKGKAATSKAKGKGGRGKKRANIDTSAENDVLATEEPHTTSQPCKGRSKNSSKAKPLSSAWVYLEDDEVMVTTEQEFASRVASASVSASTSRPSTAMSRETRSQSRAQSVLQESAPAASRVTGLAVSTRKRSAKGELKMGDENGTEAEEHEVPSLPKRKIDFNNTFQAVPAGQDDVFKLPKAKNTRTSTESDAIEVAGPSDVKLEDDHLELIVHADSAAAERYELEHDQIISAQAPKSRAKRGSRPGKRKTAAQTAAMEADMKADDPEAFEVYKTKKEAKSKKLSESATARWKAGLMDAPMAKRARTNAAKAAAKKNGTLTPGLSAADSGNEFDHIPPHVPFSEGVFQAAPQPPVISTQTLASATRNSKRPRKQTAKGTVAGMGVMQTEKQVPRLQQMSTYDQFQALSAPGSPMVLEKRRSKKVVPTQMDEDDDEDDGDDDYYGM